MKIKVLTIFLYIVFVKKKVKASYNTKGVSN